ALVAAVRLRSFTLIESLTLPVRESVGARAIRRREGWIQREVVDRSRLQERDGGREIQTLDRRGVRLDIPAVHLRIGVLGAQLQTVEDDELQVLIVVEERLEVEPQALIEELRLGARSVGPDALGLVPADG